MVKAQEEGKLKVAKRSLKIKGSSEKWRELMHKGEDWTMKKESSEEENKGGRKGQGKWQADEDQAVEVDMQRWVHCPLCDCKAAVANLKMHNGTQFSNLPCRRCTRTTNLENWQCACGERWAKCNRHYIFKFNMHDNSIRRRKAVRGRSSAMKGRQLVKTKAKADRPIPRKRVLNMEADVKFTSVMGSITMQRLRLKSSAGLAVKFPRHIDRRWK